MSDDATHKNILAIQAYSKETRKLFRELEVKLRTYDCLIHQVDSLCRQVQVLQVKLYSGGRSDGSND